MGSIKVSHPLHPGLPPHPYPHRTLTKGTQIHVPLESYNNANCIDRQRTPCLPAATGFGLINNSDKENLGGGSTSAAESNALALEQEVSRSVPAPIIHFFNHPSLVKRQSTVKESVAPDVATPRPSSNSSLIDSNNNNNPLNPLNRAYVNAFDLIMRHRNSGGEGARSMGTMNGSTAHHIGSGEGEKVSVGNGGKPVDEVSLSSLTLLYFWQNGLSWSQSDRNSLPNQILLFLLNCPNRSPFMVPKQPLLQRHRCVFRRQRLTIQTPVWAMTCL